MSRFCGERNSKPILEAAEHWRDSVLLGGSSVFTGESLWNELNVAALHEYFVQRPDLGEGKFLLKLQKQLAGTPAAAKKLASEMMWLLYLCPGSLKPPHKRKVVDGIWAWSGSVRPETRWMSDEVLNGIGSAGPGFNQNQWRELAFLINLMRAFQRIGKPEATQLVRDPWKFDEWLRAIPEWDTRQFRHMLLFLLFPDSFERIFGQTNRRTIVQVLGLEGQNQPGSMDPIQIDRALSAIRKKYEHEYKTDQLDFYVPPLRQLWKEATVGSVANALTAENVRSALEEIDRDGIPSAAQSTGYDLIEAGRRYPPKLVFSLAAKYATGTEVDRSMFTGGIDSQIVKVLEKLGFEIATKDLITPLIVRFLDQAKGGTELAVQGYLEEYRGLRVKVSFGQGHIARVPWIAFLGKDQSVSEGVYPVLLFFKERSTLLLCYGVSETNVAELSWEDVIGEAITVTEFFQKNFSRQPERYGDSLVRAAYTVAPSLRIEPIRQELDSLIDLYEEVLEAEVDTASIPHAEPELVRADIGESSKAFAAALKRSNVEFGAGHEDLAAAFISALVTKPLVILTGLSGSGKTQIAIRLGEWIGKNKLHVAAVRPDWTGAEALFGYEDGLKPPVDGRAAWAVPAPLEFILAAAADPSSPYLLLLDEMNLAHVERYFADVLSGMESEQPCIPNLVKGSDGLWRVRPQGPAMISLPRNLWIVGTVNVDETTYVFSPKVLDRANTFEFRVAQDDIKSERRKPSRCEAGDPALIRGLLTVSRDDNWQFDNAASFHDQIQDSLRRIHSVLSRYGMEFGHRVFYEALRFSAIANKAGIDSHDKVLDRIVLQKVLPRLHGARRKLELPLLALMHFCRELPASVAADSELSALEDGSLTAAKLPYSFNKLSRMLRNLRTNQFAGFAE